MNEEIVKEWLKYANDDLKAGITLFKNNPDEFKAIVCFLMQQAVEKYLKTYLIFNNKEIEKTHDIAKLIEDCKNIDFDFNSLYNINANDLTDYAVATRYPSDLNIITLEDEQEAISISEQVKLFVKGKMI